MGKNWVPADICIAFWLRIITLTSLYFLGVSTKALFLECTCGELATCLNLLNLYWIAFLYICSSHSLGCCTSGLVHEQLVQIVHGELVQIVHEELVHELVIHEEHEEFVHEGGQQ